MSAFHEDVPVVGRVEFDRAGPPTARFPLDGVTATEFFNRVSEAKPNEPTMPANPKQFYGDTKVPLHLFPTTAVVLGSMGMLEGRQKYGQDNYRAVPVEAMTYVRALLSHLNAWVEGEWAPSDSPVPHLGSVLANAAILVEAHYAGSLIDNRKFPGGYAKAIAEMQPLVQQIRDNHAEKNPKHFTIKDAEAPPQG